MSTTLFSIKVNNLESEQILKMKIKPKLLMFYEHHHEFFNLIFILFKHLSKY